MKHIIILGDGMADRSIEALGNRTPLQEADTPYMDMLARKGRNGRKPCLPRPNPVGRHGNRRSGGRPCSRGRRTTCPSDAFFLPQNGVY